MGFSDSAWDGSASQYSDTNAYCAACLIDLNPAGQDKTQANCKLPVKDTNGNVNKNAVHAAAAALAGGRGGVSAPPAEKQKAAKALIRYYSQMKEDAPPSLKRIAGS
jgi:hypothetical protein